MTLPSTPLSLNLATWISCTTAEGPGKRFALWVQGCSIRCPSCCNPDMFSPQSKRVHTIEEIFQWIQKAQQQHQIEGVTFLGGEPFEQAEPLALLAEKIRQHHLSLLIFSGYRLAEIQSSPLPAWKNLLALTDILIDGRYLQEQRTTTRRWIGSTNQNIHFLTPFYDPNDPCWLEPNTMELFFDGKEVQISGFPEERWVQEIQQMKKRFSQPRK